MWRLLTRCTREHYSKRDQCGVNARGGIYEYQRVQTNRNDRNIRDDRQLINHLEKVCYEKPIQTSSDLQSSNQNASTKSPTNPLAMTHCTANGQAMFNQKQRTEKLTTSQDHTRTEHHCSPRTRRTTGLGTERDCHPEHNPDPPNANHNTAFSDHPSVSCEHLHTFTLHDSTEQAKQFRPCQPSQCHLSLPESSLGNE